MYVAWVKFVTYGNSSPYFTKNLPLLSAIKNEIIEFNQFWEAIKNDQIVKRLNDITKLVN